MKEPDLEKIMKKIKCPHSEYCNVRKTLQKADCSTDYAETCQTYKFYNKYGEGYNIMFT